ncbi:MAG TPA: phosphoglucosamine mutase, partial [Candidatus Saccharimonadales bacterium]|nr:phosphoglucosamine mutase [Candidatus Saccharimonadales bacterium]
MTRELFGTDGVRGLAGEYPLNDEGAQRIGRAVGTHFAQAGQQILIGCDPRESSAQLVKALTEGLNSVGINVVSAGMLPTPGLAYITREHDEFVAGIMVTASHNPYQYNGIKVFDANGGKLPDNTEAIINHLIEEGAPDRGQGNFSEDHNLIHQYEDFLVNSTSGLQLNGLQIAVDAANGAASGLATRVLERLGATVTSLSDRPDGRNINAGCGATDTKALQQVVVDQKLALGIALDGDADRIIMVDHQGREVRGDYLLYILAITNHAPGIVATVMSNVAFEKELTRRGIELVRAAVGDRYVLEELLKTGYKFGGEEAGHIIMMD